jgi:hypothetical protein
MYRPPRTLIGIALLLYVYRVRTSQETRIGLHGLLRRQLYFFMKAAKMPLRKVSTSHSTSLQEVGKGS